jgi:hypothetical protein
MNTSKAKYKFDNATQTVTENVSTNGSKYVYLCTYADLRIRDVTSNFDKINAAITYIARRQSSSNA